MKTARIRIASIVTFFLPIISLQLSIKRFLTEFPREAFTTVDGSSSGRTGFFMWARAIRKTRRSHRTRTAREVKFSESLQRESPLRETRCPAILTGSPEFETYRLL